MLSGRCVRCIFVHVRRMWNTDQTSQTVVEIVLLPYEPSLGCLPPSVLNLTTLTSCLSLRISMMVQVLPALLTGVLGYATATFIGVGIGHAVLKSIIGIS